MIRVKDADHARELILRAMGRRWRVTVGFWEVRKDKNRKPVKGPNGEELFVHTVRTFEPFDVNGMSIEDYYGGTWADADYFTAMDAHTAEGRPGIRRCRFDRVTDITIHKRHPYRMPNTYFIGQVRQHAAQMNGEGWGGVAALTDDALWALIEEAWSRDDAVNKAAMYANAFESCAT